MDNSEFNAYTQRHGEEPTQAQQFGQDLYDRLNDDTVFGQMMAGALSGIAEAVADKVQHFASSEITSYATTQEFAQRSEPSYSHVLADEQPTHTQQPDNDPPNSPDTGNNPSTVRPSAGMDNSDHAPRESHFSQRMAEISQNVANDNTPDKGKDMDM